MTPAPLLVSIIGPTGSGKSDLGLQLAEAFSGEILNYDSVQIYRLLDIGTAKTPLVDRRGIPHHMLDVAEPDEVVTAGDYALRARQLLVDIAARGKVPILVGGTGFYLRALLEGLFPGPSRDAQLRSRLSALEARRPGALHRLLRRFDPTSARRIHANDINKLIRALEVCLLTRKPLSVLHAEGRDALQGFRILKIGLQPPRAQLYARLDERSRRMFEFGLMEELRRILAAGFSPDSNALCSLGYRQALEALRGAITIEEAISLTQQETRRYAKRQWTWFRRETGVEWFEGFGSEAAIQASVLHRVGREIPVTAPETFSASHRI